MLTHEEMDARMMTPEQMNREIWRLIEQVEALQNQLDNFEYRVEGN